MSEIAKVVSQNSSQLLTLISVVVGGVITYSGTYLMERRKERWKRQKEKLDNILIPYCTLLEQSRYALNRVISIDKCSENHKLDELYSKLDAPLQYLNANKRVYLSKKSRNLLQYYKDKIDTFKRILDFEVMDTLSRYKNAIEIEALNFQYPLYENIDVSIDKNSQRDLKLAILNKLEISLLKYVNGAVFYSGDIEFGSSIDISIKEEVRLKKEFIDEGIWSEDELDFDDKVGYQFLDFLDKNIKIDEEKKFLKSIIMASKSGELLEDILDTVIKLEKNILKEIDKITR